ncbi:response regulator transcription factor [Crocinitomicaceae bacterium CZZ-1]|uniref:Response regulator transcription factor n=1 Tax=Taishania pollutisoli TaxID=2766479 RepID=A0A8J6TTX8_9FLAO|nr:response regulator transcription factor [Taishania pollutisoli]MBC9813554.1 response regulator transcription factor [Taishania pollutisoli]MBX2949062.1 response regulator transcription factor [Crocinitomicaceae bacterium]NGF76008.1 response regulator transcription factor [Fluviicola sp. SGL-29]
MASKNHTILLVDDEQDILKMLSYNIEKEGYKVYCAEDGEKAVELTKLHTPSLILMDLMMPKMDGIEACQIIRELPGIKQPLITFLTSRSEDYSQIAGFSAGGDDYITKPIRPRLLMSKIESLLRRYDLNGEQNIAAAAGALVVNREKFFIEFKGEKITLPKKEFELLEMLANNPGKVYTRDQILAQVWGDETIVGERTIDVHIRKLREKLGNDYIRTIKGVGYTFKES